MNWATGIANQCSKRKVRLIRLFLAKDAKTQRPQREPPQCPQRRQVCIIPKHELSGAPKRVHWENAKAQRSTSKRDSLGLGGEVRSEAEKEHVFNVDGFR